MAYWMPMAYGMNESTATALNLGIELGSGKIDAGCSGNDG
jgi:hypothetical protein